MSGRRVAVIPILLVVGFMGLVVAPAYAQIPSAPNTSSVNVISGKYTNEEVGVQIEFPDGWEGTELFSVDSILSSVFAEGLEAASSEEITSVIMLMVSDKAQVEEPSTTKPLRVSENAEVHCDIVSTSEVQVAGLTGSESVVDCDSDGEAFKTKTALLETETNWIIVSFMAPSEEYDENVIHYDNSLQTLRVGDAIEPENDADNDLRSTTQTVMVEGKAVVVAVRSSSTVTAFELDEENKRISFQVEKETGTEGRTELFIESVLEGPYTVAIDGNMTSNFEAIEDAKSGVVVLEISYSPGTHDVVITGTNVVPEFPVSILGGFAAVIGVMILLTRQSNSFNRFADRVL